MVAKIVQRIRSLQLLNRLNVQLVQMERKQKVEVKLVVNLVPPGNSETSVKIAMPVSFVLVPMIKQQFATIVRLGFTKEMKVKDRVFPAFLDNTTMKKV